MIPLTEAFAVDWAEATSDTRLQRRQVQVFAHDRGTHDEHVVRDFNVSRGGCVFHLDAPKEGYAVAHGQAMKAAQIQEAKIILARFLEIQTDRMTACGAAAPVPPMLGDVDLRQGFSELPGDGQ